MKRLTNNLLIFAFFLATVAAAGSLFGGCQSDGILVRNVEEFHAAVAEAGPGDKIVLAKGVWKDAELLFEAYGSAEKPIVLTVEEKGKTTLEGQSNLRLAGEHLVVEGLVFRNGYTPTKEVISFRKDKETLCNHCRVTECVIDNYSNPERMETDYWVGLYGKHNRLDHNYFTGKRNHGVTVAVRLNTEASRENHHRIDHNYFGHRPILGANGGETLRIGTSHYSLTNSNTVVEFNYFDRCNGEHEIISNKSCQNVFRYNTFHECQGTLTMRHGNETLVESNYFFGNRKPNTGGIRIINEKQKVINNYCEGLTGYRFRGALVIMNGVPNSPLNRYFQVKDSEARNNTFINCDHIQLCAGSDAERSAVPVNTLVADNLFYHEQRDSLFTVYDDISGITFRGNLISPNVVPPVSEGFEKKRLRFERDASGLLRPKNGEKLSAGMREVTERATPENTGVDWYPRREEEVRFGTGAVHGVSPGENTLFEAVKASQPGDILRLEPGEYLLTKTIVLTHPLTIQAAGEKPVLRFEKNTLFAIENGGSLRLEGLVIDGSECPDAPGNTVIRTSRYSMNRNYKLFIEDCDFRKLDVNHTFDVFRAAKSTFADSVVVRGSTFRDVSGAVLLLDKETDDIGIYSAESVVIEGCRFERIGGPVLSLYRGGRDESTFGPMLHIADCTFTEVGHDRRNRSEASIALHGVQVIRVHDCTFRDSRPLRMHLVVGEPITDIRNCTFERSGGVVSNEPYVAHNLIVQ
ncbi:MAG: alginate lyase [Bacteroidetes bacterium]|nr:MAG: alginate lyase [Bacteroidota bacterium]